MAKIPPFLPTTAPEMPQGSEDFNKAFDYFQSLRDYVKFWVIWVFFFLLVLIILWNLQPWFEIEIKSVKKSVNSSLKLEPNKYQAVVM